MAPAPTTTKLLNDSEVLLTHGNKDQRVESEESSLNKMTTRSHTHQQLDNNNKASSPPPNNPSTESITKNNGYARTNGSASSLDTTTTTAVEGKAVEDIEVDMDGYSKLDIVWRNVAIFVYLHLAALYGAYLWLSGQVMWQTFLWGLKFYIMSGFGITAGTHRYWAHKSYKARTPLRILLAYMQTASFQNSIYEWCRDHRVHHKFVETNADPHNSRRGFFFAHMGWLMAKKHEAVKVKGKCVDMSDLEADPIVMFQKKYYLLLVLVTCFLIPTFVPWYFWGESLRVSFFFAGLFRYCATLHCTWLVNSAAHLWGSKPYDQRINPAENRMVAWWAFGEGWHNYHHVFPWDYKTAEVGIYRWNFSAAFIDFMAKIGWAYDLKTVPEAIVKQRVLRTGDGSHEHFHSGPWGWGDSDIPIEHSEVTQVLYHPTDKKDE